MFTFPSPPDTKRVKRTHVRSLATPSATSSCATTKQLCRRRATPPPLPSFSFPARAPTVPIAMLDRRTSRNASSGHHRRNHAISSPIKRQGQIIPAVPAIPERFTSATPTLYQPTPRKPTSPLALQLVAQDSFINEAGVDHDRRQVITSSFNHDCELLPSPESSSITTDPFFNASSPIKRPVCSRSASQESTATISSATSSCPTLMPDHSPLPSPQTDGYSIDPMEVNRNMVDADHTGFSTSYESFKIAMAAQFDTEDNQDEEDDDDEFWHCKGYGGYMPRGIVEWMDVCAERGRA